MEMELRLCRFSCLLERNSTPLTVRLHSGRKNLVRIHRLIRRDAAETRPQSAGTIDYERGKHLLEDVWEAGLEDAPGDSFERHTEAKVDALPRLFLAATEKPDGLGILG